MLQWRGLRELEVQHHRFEGCPELVVVRRFCRPRILPLPQQPERDTGEDHLRIGWRKNIAIRRLPLEMPLSELGVT